MGRPTTKEDLLLAANTNYEKMKKLISTLTSEEQELPFSFQITEKDTEAHWKRDKNIRDVIIHLYEWQKLLLDWYQNNTKGITRQFLAVGYNWKTYGLMNQSFFDKHQTTSLKDAYKMLEESHREIIKLINSLSNEALFSKDYFKWVGGSAFGQYFVSTTSSHYDWAMKKIKRQIAALKNK